MCHDAGVVQPCGISHYASGQHNERQAKTIDFVDVILVHPYYFHSDEDVERLSQDGFDDLMQEYFSLSKKYNKPILSTETCWGSRDSKIRSEIIKRTLSAHKKAGIGYVAHALHWSHVADLHDEDEGPLSFPGNLMFITKDDHIREGHEVFHDF